MLKINSGFDKGKINTILVEKVKETSGDIQTRFQRIRRYS